MNIIHRCEDFLHLRTNEVNYTISVSFCAVVANGEDVIFLQYWQTAVCRWWEMPNWQTAFNVLRIVLQKAISGIWQKKTKIVFVQRTFFQQMICQNPHKRWGWRKVKKTANCIYCTNPCVQRKLVQIYGTVDQLHTVALQQITSDSSQVHKVTTQCIEHTTEHNWPWSNWILSLAKRQINDPVSGYSRLFLQLQVNFSLCSLTFWGTKLTACSLLDTKPKGVALFQFIFAECFLLWSNLLFQMNGKVPPVDNIQMDMMCSLAFIRVYWEDRHQISLGVAVYGSAVSA